MDTILAVLYLVTIGSMGLFALFLYVLRRWTATATSYLLVLSPLVTVAVAALLAGEQISLQFALGGLLVAAGVYVGALSESTIPGSRDTGRPIPVRGR